MTDFEKGQTVYFATETRGERAAGWGPARTFHPGGNAKVTAVRRNTLTVKAGPYSYNVPRESLRAPNGEVWSASAPKPKPRKLGTPPEGQDVILPTDKRVEWLFQDAAKLADRMGYCSVFDKIADELGIPGRMRDITVDTKINGVNVRATIKARSTAEAKSILTEKLTGKPESAKVDS